jgi:hypothetical protein
MTWLWLFVWHFNWSSVYTLQDFMLYGWWWGNNLHTISDAVQALGGFVLIQGVTMKLVRTLVNNCVRFNCKENSDCWAAGNMVCVNRSSPKEWVRQVPEHGHRLSLKRREEELLLQKQAHQKYEDWIWVEKVAMTSCGQVLKNLNYQRRLRQSHRCAGVRPLWALQAHNAHYLGDERSEVTFIEVTYSWCWGLFCGGAIPKRVLHNAKIFPKGFMVSLGFQAHG